MTYYKTSFDDIIEIDGDNNRARLFAKPQTSANVWFPLKEMYLTLNGTHLTEEEAFLLLL